MFAILGPAFRTIGPRNTRRSEGYQEWDQQIFAGQGPFLPVPNKSLQVRAFRTNLRRSSGVSAGSNCSECPALEKAILRHCFRRSGYFFDSSDSSPCGYRWTPNPSEHQEGGPEVGRRIQKYIYIYTSTCTYFFGLMFGILRKPQVNSSALLARGGRTLSIGLFDISCRCSCSDIKSPVCKYIFNIIASILNE